MLQSTTFRLTDFIKFLGTYNKTYLCNAIREHFYALGYERPNNITEEVRNEFYAKFPNEFCEMGRGFGVMDIWVTAKNQNKFFGYSMTGECQDASFEELREMRINFVTYLIEHYGDVAITIELDLDKRPQM